MWESESREMSKLGHTHSWVANCLYIPGRGQMGWDRRETKRRKEGYSRDPRKAGTQEGVSTGKGCRNLTEANSKKTFLSWH